ncbi:MAG: hypothetical protein OXC98_10335 [bacterium]|nr:hypothetical protein [bacterium]
MIPRVVTTAGPFWESELVEQARLTGSLQIVRRASHPFQVQDALRHRAAQGVLVGLEIPWLSRGLISAWKNEGATVLGIEDPYQPVGRGLLEDWGCDHILEEPDPAWAATVLRTGLGVRDPVAVEAEQPRVVAVGGPRGAPGVTEVSLGLAWMAARTGPCLLVEADPSPSLGLRLGVPPPDSVYEPVTIHGIDVLLRGPGGSSGGMLASGWSRLWDYRTTVVDLGPCLDSFEQWPGQKVVVCRASPSGIVRAASFLTALGIGQRPWVVVNHLEAEESTRREVLFHLGVWAGRQPDAVIGKLDDLQWGKPPPPSLESALAPLMNRLRQPEQDSSSGLVASQHAQIAHRHQVRVEHLGQSVGTRRVDQVDKEAVAPRLGGRTRFDPGEIGASGGQFH